MSPRRRRWSQLWQPIACGGRHVLVSCSVLLISAALFRSGSIRQSTASRRYDGPKRVKLREPITHLHLYWYALMDAGRSLGNGVAEIAPRMTQGLHAETECP